LKDNSGRPALLPDLNWLHVWNSKAAAKLENLKDKNNLNTVLLPRVLPWPSNAFEGNHKDHVGARPYLELLFRKDAKPTDAKLSQFDVLHGPPKFPFAYPSPADS
jgi:hypothetical protein